MLVVQVGAATVYLHTVGFGKRILNIYHYSIASPKSILLVLLKKVKHF